MTLLNYSGLVKPSSVCTGEQGNREEGGDRQKKPLTLRNSLVIKCSHLYNEL